MALDSAILTQARKVVEKSEKKSLWNRIGWMMPLASVAVAMLTVSLFIQTKQEHPDVLDTGIMYDVTPMEESVLEKEEAAEPLMKGEKRAVQAKKTAKELIKKQKVIVPEVMQAPGFSAPPSTTGAASQTPKPKPRLKQQRRPTAASAFMAAPEPAQSDSLESGLINEEMESRDAVRSHSVRSLSETKSEATDKSNIEKWLEQIRELIRKGETDEAIKSLEKFRKAHPDYSLPEDIIVSLK